MNFSQSTINHSSMGLIDIAALATWLVLFFFFLRTWRFARPSESPTNPILLAANLRLLTAIRTWRAGGFGFLTLHTYGILPGLFAWPAGLGDIAIIKNG
jgi:hypothetical protein